jgi:hypothetical protein
MINSFRKIFEANPGKSTIELKEKCSDCGCEIIIEITSTSGGFGLNGGVLLKGDAESTFVKCPDCNKSKPRKDDGRWMREDGRLKTEVRDQRTEDRRRTKDDG